MKLIDLNRAGGIGANSFFAQLGDFNFLVDCGLHPKLTGRRAAPDFTPLRGKTLDDVLADGFSMWLRRRATSQSSLPSWVTRSCGMTFGLTSRVTAEVQTALKTSEFEPSLESHIALRVEVAQG